MTGRVGGCLVLAAEGAAEPPASPSMVSPHCSAMSSSEMRLLSVRLAPENDALEQTTYLVKDARCLCSNPSGQ